MAGKAPKAGGKGDKVQTEPKKKKKKKKAPPSGFFGKDMCDPNGGHPWSNSWQDAVKCFAGDERASASVVWNAQKHQWETENDREKCDVYTHFQEKLHTRYAFRLLVVVNYAFIALGAACFGAGVATKDEDDIHGLAHLLVKWSLFLVFVGLIGMAGTKTFSDRLCYWYCMGMLANAFICAYGGLFLVTKEAKLFRILRKAAKADWHHYFYMMPKRIERGIMETDPQCMERYSPHCWDLMLPEFESQFMEDGGLIVCFIGAASLNAFLLAWHIVGLREVIERTEVVVDIITGLSAAVLGGLGAYVYLQTDTALMKKIAIVFWVVSGLLAFLSLLDITDKCSSEALQKGVRYVSVFFSGLLGMTAVAIAVLIFAVPGFAESFVETEIPLEEIGALQTELEDAAGCFDQSAAAAAGNSTTALVCKELELLKTEWRDDMDDILATVGTACCGIAAFLFIRCAIDACQIYFEKKSEKSKKSKKSGDGESESTPLGGTGSDYGTGKKGGHTGAIGALKRQLDPTGGLADAQEITRKQWKAAFNYLDTDKSGTIDIGEMKEIIGADGDATSAMNRRKAKAQGLKDIEDRLRTATIMYEDKGDEGADGGSVLVDFEKDVVDFNWKGISRKMDRRERELDDVLDAWARDGHSGVLQEYTGKMQEDSGKRLFYSSVEKRPDLL